MRRRRLVAQVEHAVSRAHTVFLGLLAFLCGLNASAPARCEIENSRPYDLLLRGGTIIDGTGRPRMQGDVGIRGDRIALIGRASPDSTATRIIDVHGLVVAPGFIDPHAHISQIDRHPNAENFLRQGVTTIVSSLHSEDQPYPLGRYVDGLHVAPNTVWMAGHTWERKKVVGLEDRVATPSELAAMVELAYEAMADGAIGLATGLEYTPATYASTDEVIAIARVCALPNAIYVTHLRDEGGHVVEAVDEALRIGRDARLPVHINHLKATGVANWGRSAQILATLAAANSAERHVGFDVYPYTAYSTYSTVLFPGWALDSGHAAFLARIHDPETRVRLHKEMVVRFADLTAGSLDSVQFRTLPGTHAFDGKTLADYLNAAHRSLTVDAGIEALIDIQAQGGFVGIFEAMSSIDVDALLLSPLASVSTDGDLVEPGDGFPHPRSFGSFPRVLGRYVRERGLMTLEAAIAMMTSRPAEEFQIPDRGLLRAGAFADVTVFNPKRIMDRGTYTDPNHYAEGVVHLVINGVLTITSGHLTGHRAGRPIRRPNATSNPGAHAADQDAAARSGSALPGGGALSAPHSYTASRDAIGYKAQVQVTCSK